MSYEKPRLIRFATAEEIIQNVGKGSDTPLDNKVEHTNGTAYQSDE